MLKDIVGMELMGANFKEPASLDFFEAGDHKRKRMSVVYGKNGAGKSTISRAFNALKDKGDSSIVEVELRDKEGGEIQLNEEEKGSIYVFNEDYIDEKIKFQEEGINTIVLLGKHKELEEKIQTVETRIKEIREKYDRKDAEFKRYLDNNNVLSPDYYLSEMKNALKGVNNWAQRDARI